MESESSNMNLMSSLKAEDFSTEQFGQSLKTTLFSQDFAPFKYQLS